MMRARGWKIFLLVILVFSGSHFLREMWLAEKQLELKGGGEGVVALAPSTTEVVYALGAGDELVGVSRFVSYPKEALALPKVGGYTDLDLEALLRLNPRLVVLLEEQGDVVGKLSRMGVDSVMVDHASVDGIMESLLLIGSKMGKQSEAEALRQTLQAEMDRFREKSASNEQFRVLLCIGRELGSGKISSVVAAGSAGYHRDLLTLAGVRNAYEGGIPFPSLTKEHLLEMNPDIIIELVTDSQAEEFGEEAILTEWQELAELKAVHGRRVHLLVGDKHFIPGPRFIETLREMYQLIHQEK